MKDNRTRSSKSIRSSLGRRTSGADGVSFALKRGTLTALIGGSAPESLCCCARLRTSAPDRWENRLLGTDVWQAPRSLNAIGVRLGMMFQDGALFSSMTVAQNVAVPLLDRAVPTALLDPLIKLRLRQAGLGPERLKKCPVNCQAAMRNEPRSRAHWRRPEVAVSG